MKKYIIFMMSFMMLFLFNCSSPKWTTIGNGEKMKIEYNLDSISYNQIDSICKVDSLSNDLKNKWLYLPLISGETNNKIEKYMYIKKLDSLEIMYIIQKYKNEENYSIQKRITY